ncbi:hypothetical protein [Planktothrix sp. FACHB-1365]|uniref:hypothetical protein n=1 Tax=Planktothrix sp. FACHB-1365 TaxID=2692855 RepID=UPI001681D31A|nr:hypothetical protein [Planktothrix sp. FACHB-1365]MBD2483143.1 hypothetical protein [Planktothrix sp. FACHB-1365]
MPTNHPEKVFTFSRPGEEFTADEYVEPFLSNKILILESGSVEFKHTFSASAPWFFHNNLKTGPNQVTCPQGYNKIVLRALRVPAHVRYLR